MSYWKVDDTMRIGNTFISIPSENGLDYSENQKIQLFIDPSTKYMDGHNSYLEFNVKIELPTTAGTVPTRLQLDEMGATALLKNIRIYDGSRGQILEEFDSYSSLCSVRYDYDTDDSMRNYRALREGASVHTPSNRGTEGTSKTPMANTITNPYFKKVGSANNTTVWSSTDFLTAKVCIPLHTGIFAQNEHIFPVMMTNGLYIEIDTAPAREVIKQLDSVCRLRRSKLNPYFHSIGNGSTSVPVGTDDIDTIYVQTKNNLGGSDRVSKFPFVVGETFGFANGATPTTKTTLTGTRVITAINASTNGLIEVQTTTPFQNNGAGATVIDATSVMYSTAVEESASYDATYKISNVNLVVSQVHLDPAYEAGMIQKVREGKAIEIDILTATNYKHSILASDRQTTYQVYANNSRAKSLLIIPQDSSVYSAREQICGLDTYDILKAGDAQDGVLQSNRSGYTGICDELQEIQYQLEGRLVPSRPINVSKIASRQSIESFHLYELEKCLDNAGIAPRSFRKFQENFIFGRGFAVNQGAIDLRQKDLAVILKYTGTEAPSKGKLFNSFVIHVRRLMIRDGSVEVIP